MDTENRPPVEGTKVRGMYHVRITDPDGTIKGDSGWHENVVVNDGFLKFLVDTLGAISGSMQLGYMALGTGTEPGAAHTTLDGEVVKRAAVTASSTVAGSKTLRLLATFASVDSFVGATVTLKNIGLFCSQYSSNSSNLFAGNTYATSTCATNQAVNCTYDVIFS